MTQVGDTVQELSSALAGALAPELGSRPRITGLERLSGGASRESWRFDVTLQDGRRRGLVLRRDPPGRPSPEGGMAREAAALRASRAAGLAVPEVLVVSEGPDLWGSAGMVMERVEGETIAPRILREDRYTDARHHLASQCGRFLGGLHALGAGEVEGLQEQDTLVACRDLYELLGRPSPTFELAMRWLSERRPETHGPPSVVHGDFRLGNLVVDASGLRAVLDWEGVHLGDPLEDLGWLCVKAWRFRSPFPVGGFGTYEQLVDAYAGAGGRAVAPDALRWWEVLGALRWGVICMAQAEMHLSGTVRSVELAAIGRRVCEQEWDLLALIDPEATARATENIPHPAPEDPPRSSQPTATELIGAVHGFLMDEVFPSVEGRLQFQTRVAANVVGMLEREARLGREHQRRLQAGLATVGTATEADLAMAVRRGDFDGRKDQLVTVLANATRDRLLVANPRHLEVPA